MNKLPNNKDRLLLSKKNSTLIIFDPFCGSGTIPIEASAYVTNLLPGRLRAPPLLGTTLYDEKLWERTLLSLSTASRGHGLGMDTNLKVLASDRDNGAI
jgi:23S rRNA G2445 N2-methylase RlmL